MGTTRREFLKTTGLVTLGLAAAACGPGGSTAGSTASPGTRTMKTVKITDIQITSAAGSYIAAEKGYFKEEYIDAQFLLMSGADQVPAILSGTADASGTAINAALYNALARGVGAKMVADHGANLKGASAGGWVVRKDLVDSGKYKTPADAKGYKVAVGTPAATPDIDLDRLLRQGGLTIKDINYQVMNFPDMIPAFAGKALDAAIFQEPFTTLAVKQGVIWRGPTGFDIYPNQQIAALTFGEQMASDKDLCLRYLRAYVRGVRDYVKGIIQKDKTLHDEVVQILIKHTTQKDPSLYDAAIPSGLHADPVLNAQSIVDDLDWMVKAGKVTTAFDVRKHIDSSLVEQAIKDVGPAK